MTNLIVVMHGLLKTNKDLPPLLAKILQETNSTKIIDLCSGGGGPMVEAVDILKKDYNLDVELKMTDLYPNIEFAKKINDKNNNRLTYATQPIDATNVPSDEKGLRTMICSFHHMRPKVAQQILKNAKDDQQPIFIYEISDNSPPIFAFLIALPINFIMCLFVTLKVRPMTWQQIVFTYMIPIIPLCFAWDGSISNARTYTIKDMNVLLEDLQSDDYVWETGTIKGKPSGKLYLMGRAR